jgi:hypothetical protein
MTLKSMTIKSMTIKSMTIKSMTLKSMTIKSMTLKEGIVKAKGRHEVHCNSRRSKGELGQQTVISKMHVKE